MTLDPQLPLQLHRRDPRMMRRDQAILEDASKPSLSAFVSDTTAPGAIVRTDGWKGYNGLTELGYDHAPMTQGPEPVGDPPYLPRAHRAISNLKACLHGTHRRASRQPSSYRQIIDEAA